VACYQPQETYFDEGKSLTHFSYWKNLTYSDHNKEVLMKYLKTEANKLNNSLKD